MKQLFFLSICLLLFTTCQTEGTQKGADKVLSAEEMEALRGKMYDEQTHRIDEQLAQQYIDACKAYATANPNEEQSASFLFKAGETARSIRQFDQALAIYDWIYTKFPKHEKAPQALFLKAFTLDNDIGKRAEAKVLYEDFLAKYPNDDFADDTRFLLDNLGKSDDEIIKSFEKTEESTQ